MRGACYIAAAAAGEEDAPRSLLPSTRERGGGGREGRRTRRERRAQGRRARVRCPVRLLRHVCIFPPCRAQGDYCRAFRYCAT